MDNCSTNTDQKMKWAGILERPFISRLQRKCLDGNNAQKLKNAISNIEFDSLLDVGCGLGEYQLIKRARYVGLDNSLKHIDYAKNTYSDCRFVYGDANTLPFKDNSFDAVLFACATHHFDQEPLKRVLLEMKRVSKKYIIIDDAIRYERQGRLSQLLYGLDRGTMFRTSDELVEILSTLEGCKLIKKSSFKSFPGFYLHAVFVLEFHK